MNIITRRGYVFINLLPYRDVIRKEKTKQLSLYMMTYLILAFCIIFAAYSKINIDEELQQSRNSFIEKENKKLDIEIQEIADLRTNIQSTLSKRKIVEDLQTNRSDVVKVLNDLSNSVPDGIVLNNMTQKGDVIRMTGYTNSNNKVSNFMTNMTETGTFENPVLVQIVAAPQQRRGVPNSNSNFELLIKVKRGGERTMVPEDYGLRGIVVERNNLPATNNRSRDAFLERLRQNNQR